MTAPNISIGVVGDDPAHLEQALAVLHGGLGLGFIRQEELLTYTVPKTAQPYRGALAAREGATGRVIGVLMLGIVDEAALRASFLDSYEQMRADAATASLRPGHSGLIKSIVVSPAYQGRGIASALIARGLADLTAHGAEHTYSLAWESNEYGCQLCGVLTAAGFHTVRRIERFWYNDSIVNAYMCPVCGNPCTCAVRVMIR